MFRCTFQANPLFHFEPSQVSFKGILSSMLGLLQARQAFIFPRNTTWPKSRETVQRRNCALLRAKTSALLRRKTCAVLRPQHMSCFSIKQMSWLSTRHMSCISTLRYAQCSQPTQRKLPLLRELNFKGQKG